LHLRIDELVLSGFEASRRYAIAGAIHRELERLFREGGVPSELSMGAPTDAGVAGGASVRRDVLTLNAGSFEIPHDATPETVGIQVARSIHRGLGGSTINAAQQGSRSGGFQGGAQS
jgi:hypothetical protein